MSLAVVDTEIELHDLPLVNGSDGDGAAVTARLIHIRGALAIDRKLRIGQPIDLAARQETRRDATVGKP